LLILAPESADRPRIERSAETFLAEVRIIHNCRRHVFGAVRLPGVATTKQAKETSAVERQSMLGRGHRREHLLIQCLRGPLDRVDEGMLFEMGLVVCSRIETGRSRHA